MTTTHVLKSWPQFYQAIVDGTRTSDIRAMDRPYRIGDHLWLKEYDPFKGAYTGRECWVEVTHIISNDTPCALSSAVLQKGYCVLSIKYTPPFVEKTSSGTR